MGNISLEQINSMFPDVLTEIGNIGAGNATTAIANMLNVRIRMKVPKVELMPVEDIVSSIGSEEDVVVGIMFGVQNDIQGSMMYLMDLPSAHHLVNRLMMRDINYDKDFDEMDMSAIQEVGNIIASSYLSALSGLTNLMITPTVPYVAIDMAGAILSVPAIQFGMIGDNALMINTEMGDDLDISGYYILMPEGDSYQKILKALGLPI